PGAVHDRAPRRPALRGVEADPEASDADLAEPGQPLPREEASQRQRGENAADGQDPRDGADPPRGNRAPEPRSERQRHRRAGEETAEVAPVVDALGGKPHVEEDEYGGQYRRAEDGAVPERQPPRVLETEDHRAAAP